MQLKFHRSADLWARQADRLPAPYQVPVREALLAARRYIKKRFGPFNGLRPNSATPLPSPENPLVITQCYVRLSYWEAEGGSLWVVMDRADKGWQASYLNVSCHACRWEQRIDPLDAGDWPPRRQPHNTVTALKTACAMLREHRREMHNQGSG